MLELRIMSMLRRSLVAFAVLLAVVAGAWPSSARADTELLFNPVAKGLARQLVDRAWASQPEYKQYLGFLGMLPPYMIATHDINGDSTPEIFARHSDPDSGFCDAQGVACQMIVYAYTSTGLYEIGRIMAAAPVTVSSAKTSNINDLVVTNAKLLRETYKWNGKGYEKSN